MLRPDITYKVEGCTASFVPNTSAGTTAYRYICEFTNGSGEVPRERISALIQVLREAGYNIARQIY